MRLVDALYEGWLSVSANPLRSTLAVLGIAIGVGALVAVLAIGAGTQKDVLQRIESLGAHLIYVTPAPIESHGIERRMGALTLEDGTIIAKDVAALDAVAPVVNVPGRVVWRNQNDMANIQGTTNDYFKARDWKISAGRLFRKSELQRGAKVGIIGQSLLKSLFENRPPQDALGEVVRIENMPVEIIGVLEAKGLAPQGFDQDDKIIMPIKTVQLRLRAKAGGDRTDVQSLFIKTTNAEAIPNAQVKITELLRARHHLTAGRPNDFKVLNLAQFQQAASDAAASLQFWLSVVASISLLVGGVNIMNVMLVNVTERTREIGIRVAIGARSRDLALQFFAEALVISVIGGLIGVATGSALAVLVGQWRSVPIDVDLAAVGIAMLFAVGVGVVFSAYPAYRASRQNAAAALKFE